MNKPLKIAIVGVGNVGAACAHALINQGLCGELVLVDIKKEKAEGEAWDLSQGNIFMQRRVKVYCGSYKDCGDADYLIFSAAAGAELGGDRLSVLEANAKVAQAVLDGILEAGFGGILIAITNPVDIIAYYFYKKSGFPQNRILGTGTSLDSARLSWYIAEACGGLDPRSVRGYNLGEHGESQITAWSGVEIGGSPYLELRRLHPEIYASLTLDELHGRSVRSGWDIYERKGTTWYGIAGAASDIIRALSGDEKRILPVSVLLEGQYGESGAYASLPAVLGSGGVERVLAPILGPEEEAGFKASAALLRKHAQSVLH